MIADFAGLSVRRPSAPVLGCVLAFFSLLPNLKMPEKGEMLRAEEWKTYTREILYNVLPLDKHRADKMEIFIAACSVPLASLSDETQYHRGRARIHPVRFRAFTLLLP